MITVGVESFNVVEQNQHLIKDHWEEVAGSDNSGRELDVDWELFRTFEKHNRLVTIVARDNGEMAGYAVFIIQNHFHAKKTICAHNDAIFLRKESRKGRAGFLLIKESKNILEKLYPKVLILWHVKPHVDFGNFLLKIGYKKHETIYSLNVGD